MAEVPAFRFAICQEGLPELPFAEVAALCADIGYEGMELAPYLFADDIRSVDAAGRARIASAARDAGVEITGLHWLLVKPEGMHINSPDESIRRHTADYLKALCDFCADVGGKTLTLGSPKARNVAAGLTYEKARGYVLETLVEVGGHAADRGVVLCIESLPSPDTDFITTAREALILAREAASPGIAMMLDTKSMCSEAPRTIPEIIAECREWMRHFHANDANRRGPGFGDVDFVPVFRSLIEAGYDGWVSVEAFEFVPTREEAARESLAYMRRCLSEAMRK